MSDLPDLENRIGVAIVDLTYWGVPEVQARRYVKSVGVLAAERLILSTSEGDTAGRIPDPRAYAQGQVSRRLVSSP